MTDNAIAKRPSHTIYKVVGDGETANWVKVGVGFAHKDGHGVALVFDGIPVEGRIALREIKAKTPEQQSLPNVIVAHVGD